MAAWLLLALAGCGGSTTAATGVEHPRASEGAPLKLTVRLADGEWIDVGDLRGRLVLVVLLTTYDAVCQAQLVPLNHIAHRHPEIPIVGVLSQEEASQLLAAYVDAVHPAFPLGYDADAKVLVGETAIGSIEAVPLIVSLDRTGRIVERHVGFAGEGDIEAILSRADARVPEGSVPEAVPLMGVERPGER